MTTTAQRIEIALSKKKILLMLLGSLAFFALGLWFIISPQTISSSNGGSPTTIVIAAYATILFFGLSIFVLIKKLLDSKPGIIIDQICLTDNSSGMSAGHILWSDIEDISVIEIQRQKLIMLQVRNPLDYIDKQTSGLKRKMMQMNYKMYGTPIIITSNGLKISFEELLSILTDKLN